VTGVTITYVAGYADVAHVPQSIKQAMLLLLATWYENREDVVIDRRISSVSLAKGVDALLWRNKVPEPI
jgi:uncharacterized phiE125 gp8 family phage protein